MIPNTLHKRKSERLIKEKLKNVSDFMEKMKKEKAGRDTYLNYETQVRRTFNLEYK